MAAQDIPTNEPAVKAEPVITGLGKYRTEGDGIVEIKYQNGIHWFDREWGEGGHAWKSDGAAVNTFSFNKLSDIVSRVDTPAEAGPFLDDETLCGMALRGSPAPELAGLTGYVSVNESVKHDFDVWGCDSLDEALSDRRPFVIDLATITKDQLVQPKPEPVKRTARVWVFDTDTIITRWKDENSFPGGGAGKLVAHFEIEIEYTPGEGLGDVS